VGQLAVFSDLPTILARNFAEDGLQVELGMLQRFGARKMGTQPLLPLVQAQQPAANGRQGCFDGFGCGMIQRLHAVLAFDGSLNEEDVVLFVSIANSVSSFLENGVSDEIDSPSPPNAFLSGERKQQR
jgi:hypothetical protein